MHERFGYVLAVCRSLVRSEVGTNLLRERMFHTRPTSSKRKFNLSFAGVHYSTTAMCPFISFQSESFVSAKLTKSSPMCAQALFRARKSPEWLSKKQWSKASKFSRLLCTILDFCSELVGLWWKMSRGWHRVCLLFAVRLRSIACEGHQICLSEWLYNFLW